MKNENYQNIKTFSDACIAVGINEELFYQHCDYLSKYLLNTAKLEIINKAINGSWILNWDDSNEYKYYPYFKMGSVSSGFGFSGSSCGYGVSSSLVGSHLCTYSSDVSNYISEQFNDLYVDWFCVSNQEINGVTVDDMEQIYSIACKTWKEKIISLTNEYKDKNPFINKVYLPEKIINEMIKACTEEQLPIVKKIFKID